MSEPQYKYAFPRLYVLNNNQWEFVQQAPSRVEAIEAYEDELTREAYKPLSEG